MDRQRVLAGLLGILAWMGDPLSRVLAASKDEPPELKSSVPLWAVLCSLVALGGICVVAFKNAKRTHLD